MTAPQRLAWVAGGAQGICREVALRLSAHHRVVVLDVAPWTGTVPSGLRSVDLDVCDTRAVDDFVDGEDEDLPDILINGVGGDTRRLGVEQLTEADAVSAIQFNLLPVVHLTVRCVPSMWKLGWGRIVNFASSAAMSYSPFSNAAYAAAKAAVIGWSKQAGYELAGTGVTVNVVAPGPISTDRVVRAWDALSEQAQDDLRRQLPTGRYGTVDEAASAVMMLCGEEAGYMIGSVVNVTGGLYL